MLWWTLLLLRWGPAQVRLDAIAKLGGSRAVEAPVMALGDQDRQVRRIAANLLARSGPRAVEPLIVSLNADDPMLRREAANVLTSLRDPRALEPLIAATCDPNEDVRWAAGSALLAIGDRRAIEPLVHLLMRGDDVSSVYLQSLLATLQRTPHSVPVETLLDLRHLASVIGPTGRVDCSAFRQFAQEELTRRGIQS